jgi:hypothetical protein
MWMTVAALPVDHINLLKVSFPSQIAATPPFFSATCALSAAPTGFVFISWACCFCSILDEVARAKSGSLRPNWLAIGDFKGAFTLSGNLAVLPAETNCRDKIVFPLTPALKKL